MAVYTVETMVPVFVDIIVPEDGEPKVVKVQVSDEAVPATLMDVLATGGKVMDANGLEVKPSYSEGSTESDWDAIERGYQANEWPAWDLGF